MLRTSVKLLILLALCVPAWSWGYSIYTPQGHREALMGNTGLAMNASEGAAIYNPAGAAGLESARISAGGSLLNASVFKIGDGSQTGLSDKSTSPSFTQIPGLITGYQKSSWGRTGFFINTDYSLTFDKLIAFSSSFGTSYSEMVTSLNSLNLGLVYANSADLTSDVKFQYGITISLNMLETQQSLFNKSFLTANSSYVSEFSNTNVKTTNLLARFGTLVASPNYSIGAYYQPKGSDLSSSYSKFSYQVSSAGPVNDESKNSGPPLLSPEAYGLGLGFAAGKSLKLYIDANILVPDDAGNEDAQGDRVESLGLGGDYTMASGNHIYGGVSHAEAKSKNKTQGITVSSGFDYRISFIKNYFGVYYSSLVSPANTETGSSGTSISWFGILIASQYSF